MTVFRDGGTGDSPEDAIRRAIEQSGSALADKLSKLLAGMPQGQIVRILGGERLAGVDEDDMESLRRIAKAASSGSKVEGSNFATLGDEKRVDGGAVSDDVIGLLEDVE